jgi:hypothetical protein
VSEIKSKSDGLKLNFAKKDNISKEESQVKGLTCAGVPEVYLVCFYWGGDNPAVGSPCQPSVELANQLTNYDIYQVPIMLYIVAITEACYPHILQRWHPGNIWTTAIDYQYTTVGGQYQTLHSRGTVSTIIQ